MYWVKKDDGNFEVLDGQQRTISICRFMDNMFSIDLNGNTYLYRNFQQDMRDLIDNYELTVYICEGGDTEKLEWFQTINIAGEELSDQEMRNAVYSGEWVTEAKRYFSRNGCPAIKVGGDYVNNAYLRQELLEKAIDWVASAQGKSIKQYMAEYQHYHECSDLWNHFRAVIEWVECTFTKRRKEMKSVDWGLLYNLYGCQKYVITDLNNEVERLMKDDDVTSKPGIYRYVLSGETKWLNIRSFSPSDKRSAYEKQKGVCPVCGKHYDFEEMEADHIIPWSKGGKTEPGNCQMLCRRCNREKGNA